MDTTIEKRARREHNRARAKAYADLCDCADDAIALDHQIIDRLLEQPEIRLVFQAAADGSAIQHAIGLRTRGTHGRPFAGVEDTELDTRLVCRDGHGTAQRIDFLDQVPLADATDRRVATHLPQRLDIVRKQ